MTSYNTQGLGPAQIEPLARLVMSPDRLFWLVPFLVGFWLNAVLFGVLVVLFARWQVGVARTDKAWVRGIVYYLFALHCLTTAYFIAQQEHMFAEGFGKYRNLIDITWARPSYIMFPASHIPCSAFFTYRAWVMYRRHWAVPLLVGPLSLGSAACAVGTMATFEYMPLPVLTRRWVLGMTSLALAADVSLTALLTAALLRSRTRTEYERTNQLIWRIVRTLVETQSVPTLTATLQLLVTAKWGDTSQVAYFHAAPRVYPICLLIMLNSRAAFTQLANDRERKQVNANIPTTPSGDDGFHFMTKSRSCDSGILVEKVTHTHVTVEDWTPYPSVRRSVIRGPPVFARSPEPVTTGVDDEGSSPGEGAKTPQCTGAAPTCDATG